MHTLRMAIMLKNENGSSIFVFAYMKHPPSPPRCHPQQPGSFLCHSHSSANISADISRLTPGQHDDVSTSNPFGRVSKHSSRTKTGVNIRDCVEQNVGSPFRIRFTIAYHFDDMRCVSNCNLRAM